MDDSESETEGALGAVVSIFASAVADEVAWFATVSLTRMR